MNPVARFAAIAALSLTAATAVAAPPATQPTAAPSPPAVYVAAFRPLNPSPTLDWAGRAVQQNLVTDLARAGVAAAAADHPLLTTAEATAAAQSARARYVVTGTYQYAEPRVRLDGQVIDVATGTAVGGLSATGEARDLFALEDALSAQLLARLRPPPSSPPTPAEVAARPVPPELQRAAVVAALTPPPVAASTHYQGSALQAYVDANRTPSQDYTQQVIDARDRNTFGSYGSTGAPLAYGGFGLGGGLGYGGDYGYSSGYGGYLPGVSYPVGSVGYGNGGFGYRGFGGFGFHGGLAVGGRGR